MYSQDHNCWAYLAGLLDGEGYMAVYQNGPRLGISNTHLGVLEEIVQVTGHGVVSPRQWGARTKKRCYQWDVNANGIREVLPYLIPHMRVKKQKALILLEYLEYVRSVPKGKLPRDDPHRLELIQQMKEV